jgi:hypothetical protein
MNVFTITRNNRSTDKPVFIVWDGLNAGGRESNGLDDDMEVLGSLETTRLLVDYDD